MATRAHNMGTCRLARLSLFSMLNHVFIIIFGAFGSPLWMSVILIFLVLMVLSWVRSRNLPDDDMPATPTEHAPKAKTDTDHFSLK